MWGRRRFGVVLEGEGKEVLLRGKGRVRLVFSEVGRRGGEKAGAKRLVGSAGSEELKLRRVRKRVRMGWVRKYIL